MPYDLYPAVDQNYNFPPEVRQSLAVSPELRNTVVPMTTAERNNLLPSQLWDGRVITNTTTDRMERYDLGTTQWYVIADSTDLNTKVNKAGDIMTGPLTVVSPTLKEHPARAGQPDWICTSTTRPTGVSEGFTIWETDTKRELIWTGTNWRILSVPAPRTFGASRQSGNAQDLVQQGVWAEVNRLVMPNESPPGEYILEATWVISSYSGGCITYLHVMREAAAVILGDFRYDVTTYATMVTASARVVHPGGGANWPQLVHFAQTAGWVYLGTQLVAHFIG